MPNFPSVSKLFHEKSNFLSLKRKKLVFSQKKKRFNFKSLLKTWCGIIDFTDEHWKLVIFLIFLTTAVTRNIRRCKLAGLYLELFFILLPFLPCHVFYSDLPNYSILRLTSSFHKLRQLVRVAKVFFPFSS